MCARKGNLTKLNYMEIKQLIDRKVIENKKEDANTRGNPPVGQGST
jgi:hypothetical protein